MKFWSHEELYEIEEELLRRKEAIKYLPSKDLKKVGWAWTEWERELVEQCASDGCTSESIENFLVRARGSLNRYVRSIGYENWTAYCEVIQGVSRDKLKRLRKPGYREILESVMGRPLTKEEHVHHVNLDHYDDTLENLWLCNSSNHKHAHASYRRLQKALIGFGVIVFDIETGEYRFNQGAVEEFVKNHEEDDLLVGDFDGMEATK